MAYIATLKKNNTVIYPQTKSTAVYEDDGVTALDTVVVKKSTAVGDANKMIKADGTKALVGASNIDFTTIDFGDYSTSEVATNYKWIDGRTIYKKTVSVGPLPNATNKSVAHSISNLRRVIKIEGYAYNNSVTEPLPMCTTVANYNVEVNVGTTYIVLTTGADRSNFTEAYVTIYYTKTS